MPSVEERLQRAATALDTAIDEAVAAAPSATDRTQLTYRLAPAGRDRRRFTVAMVSAAAVAVGVIGIAVVAGPGSDEAAPSDAPAVPVEQLEPNTWTAFPPPPIEPRFQYAAVATDGGLFVWGGCCTDSPVGDFFHDGAYYDTASGSWRVLPESPLDPNHGGAIAAWTGDEVVVLNGVDGIHAAAFDPVAFSWRELAAPTGDHAGSGTSELLALPDGRIAFVITIHEESFGHGVRVQIYDPSTDQWTAAAAPRAEFTYGLVPIPASVLGVAVSDVGIGVLSVTGPDCSTLAVDVYNTTADTWSTTPLGTSDWHPADIAGIDDGRFLVTGGTACSDSEPDQRAVTVDPTGEVEPAADVPIPVVRGALEGIWTGQWAIRLNGDGRTLAYDPADDRWLVGASVLDASGAAANTVIWQTPMVWVDGQLVVASPGYEHTDGNGGLCCYPEREAWTYRFLPDVNPQSVDPAPTTAAEFDGPQPTTPSTAPSGSDSAALDLSAQTVFGVGVGYISSDQVLEDVTAELGPASSDTGWYSLPSLAADNNTTDCLANIPSRILRWGDLAIAFFDSRFGVGGEFLWSWSIGAPISSQSDRREPNMPVSPEPTGLRTADGISVGSTVDDVTIVHGQRFQFIPDPDNPHISNSYGEIDQATGSAIRLRATDGVIDGMGASLSFC